MSLRLRLILALLIINAGVLGTLAWWTAEQEDAQRLVEMDRRIEMRERLTKLGVPRFRLEELGDLAKMLDWPLWTQFEDALIVDTRVLEFGEGRIPVGTFLNPLGRRHRSRDFPLAEVTEAVILATEEDRTVPVGDGLAIPLKAYEPFAEDPRPWGGLYVELPLLPEGAGAWALVLIAALASTLVGGAAIVLLTSRLVLRPVESLVDVTEAFGQGSGRRDLPKAGAREVVKLASSFERMMTRIEGFQSELESEVEEATARALEADRLAAHRERMAAMGALAAGVAHEINSPLAGALHALEVLRLEASSEKGEQYGLLIQEALERVRDLVQRLLKLTPGRAEASEVELAPLLEDLRAFLASRLQSHSLTFELAQEEMRIPASRGDLFPLLLNLFQNSLDALDGRRGGEPGLIQVHAQELADGTMRIVLEDDGPGAPEEILPHLFEPFFTSKDVGHGTGLGLALAHAAMRRMGGSIRAGNREPVGFQVVLEFPALPDAGTGEQAAS